jgi:dihydrofolate reductase
MGRLVFTSIASLDGYVADAWGGFDWAAPDDEVHAYVNSLEHETGTYLLGRRMYETMRYWETAPTSDPGPVADRFATLWQAADKVVYSTTLPAVQTARTRLERWFSPSAARAMAAASERDVSIGGPTLAAHALRARAVDEVRIFRVPTVVGGGTPALPEGARFDVELLDARTFGNGTTYARYAVRR